MVRLGLFFINVKCNGLIRVTHCFKLNSNYCIATSLKHRHILYIIRLWLKIAIDQTHNIQRFNTAPLWTPKKAFQLYTEKRPMVHIIYLSNNSIAGPLLYRSMLHYIFPAKHDYKIFLCRRFVPWIFLIWFYYMLLCDRTSLLYIIPISTVTLEKQQMFDDWLVYVSLLEWSLVL